MTTRSFQSKKPLTTRVWLSMIAITIMALVAILAPLLSPFDPQRMQIDISSIPPAWYNTPTQVGRPDHFLGTDMYGRDIFSHVIHGTRAAMFLILVTIPLTALIGTTMGVVAGSGNKILEMTLLRFTDVINSVPTFMFAVIIIFIVRETPTGRAFGGLITLTLAFALVNWVGLARQVYPAVLRIRQQEFMVAARSLGAGVSQEIFKHILPHISHLIVVWVVNNIPAVILLEALLGYIGIAILQVTDGSSFQDLSWGGLILLGRTQLNRNPYILLVPTVLILVMSMSFSVLGEYLNEKFNPQLETTEMI